MRIPLNYILNPEENVIVKPVEEDEKPKEQDMSMMLPEEEPEEISEEMSGEERTEAEGENVRSQEADGPAESALNEETESAGNARSLLSSEDDMEPDDDGLQFDFDFPTEEEIEALMREGAFEDEDDE